MGNHWSAYAGLAAVVVSGLGVTYGPDLLAQYFDIHVPDPVGAVVDGLGLQDIGITTSDGMEPETWEAKKTVTTYTPSALFWYRIQTGIFVGVAILLFRSYFKSLKR